MKERASSLIFVVFLAGLVCSCSKENRTSSGPSGGAESGGGTAGMAGSQNATPLMKFQLPPITDLHQLLTNKEEAFWTRNVDISDAMVQRVFRDKQFVLVGPDDSHTVPVQLNRSYPQIKEGQEITILGIVDPLGDVTQWNVLPAERQALAAHTMFIRAVSIKLSSH